MSGSMNVDATAGARGARGLPAQLDVNVAAPRGTKVNASGGNVFEKVKLTRTPQMAKSGSVWC
jgi:hypothetical protein